MIARRPPQAVRYQRDPLWERSKEFQRLALILRDDPGARLPAGLTDAKRVALEAEAASSRWGGLTRGEYRSAIESAIDETRPRVVAPVSDAPTHDLINAWRQPEARELWRRIIAEQRVTRSTVPSLHFALGVMLALGAMRSTPHVLHAHDLLLNNAPLFGLVSDLAMSCNGVSRCEPARRSYAQVTRHLPRLAEELAVEAHIALAQIASKFSDWGIPVGRYLAVDGSLAPAWAPQRSAHVDGVFNPALEDRLRRRTPDARYIVYSGDYEEDRLSDQGGSPKGARGIRGRPTQTRVRGYRLTCIVDLLTSITLAFDLREATSHEPRTLREVLLPTMFQLSPQLAVRAIVGDAKYDDNPTHEHLETHYGIHLVAARKAHALGSRGTLFKEVHHPSVAAVRGDGIAICRAHGRLLEYRGLDAPQRTVVRPGEPTNPAGFRSRFFCADGCGKVSIPTQSCWSNLPYFPHTPHGRLKLFASRRALLHQRNLVEASFSALQVGYKQCLDGAARVRVFDRSVNEALIAISIVTRALHLLAAERARRGELV